MTALFSLEAKGFLKIYFADESGFSLTPYVPYGWRKTGKQTGIPSEHGSRINVFGLMSRDNELKSYYSSGSFTSALLTACIDDFAAGMNEARGVIVMDNASVRRSRKFQEKIEEWKEQELYVFFPPRYSPHLNLIEILWRKVKYEWLKPKDYETLKTLEEALKNILIGFGRDLFINFKQPEVTII
jgi:transposase